ncbi:MAG: VWA domain-containing protein [Bacteroidota bacterium]
MDAEAQIRFSEKEINLATIPEAYEIRGDVILTNASAAKIYLLRADAEKGVKIYTSKKTLLPADTCLLVISFIPSEKGRFNKTIKLVASDQDKPYELNLSGNLLKVKADDKTACYYFGNRRNNSIALKEGPVVINAPAEKRDNSNKMPDPSAEPLQQPATTNPGRQPDETPKSKVSENELSRAEFKPNNILFLVDVSGSMKDSLKLPLMKSALHTLIDVVRDVDRMTFVTYADSVKVIKEGLSGADKKTLHELVDGLKAHGLTKGNKAILFSQLLAQKYYIRGGNNQILLATDGKFNFSNDNFKTWTERQQDKKIIISTVAFGDDKTAMKNLKEIAERGQGSFIHIKKRNGSHEKLLNEMKERSKIQ